MVALNLLITHAALPLATSDVLVLTLCGLARLAEVFNGATRLWKLQAIQQA